MKRIAVGAALLGFLLIVAGFAYDSMFAGIPYQDPTPELVARYAHHAEIAAWIGRSGLALLIAGIGLAILRLGLRRLGVGGDPPER
jgi:hypothetical protein